MAGERFGALDLAANTDTFLMESILNFDSTVNVSFANRNNSTIAIRLALVDASSGTAVASLSNEDYLEFDTAILANEVLERTGIVVPQGHSLVVRADTLNVSVVAHGFAEERI